MPIFRKIGRVLFELRPSQKFKFDPKNVIHVIHVHSTYRIHSDGIMSTQGEYGPKYTCDIDNLYL